MKFKDFKIFFQKLVTFHLPFALFLYRNLSTFLKIRFEIMILGGFSEISKRNSQPILIQYFLLYAVTNGKDIHETLLQITQGCTCNGL